MGQQQLLLLIIGVIIVGISVLAAFEALDRHFKQDEADGLLDRGLTIATHAVHWKATQDPYAGGDQSYEGLSTDGLKTLATEESTIRGRYEITSATANTLQITGVSTRYDNIGVRVYVREYGIDSSIVRFDGSIALSE
jgi:hypothetical protein